MLTPNSIPARPQPAAFAEAEGKRAPPPQTMPSSSRSIVVSSRSSLSASPRKPESATSKFEPEPITPRARPSSAAHANTASSSPSFPGRAKKSASPPVRTVVSRARGKSRVTKAGGELTASPVPSQSMSVQRNSAGSFAGPLGQILAQPEDVTGADSDQDLVLDADAGVSVQEARERGSGVLRLRQPEHPPAPHPLSRRLRDLQSAHPGELADRPLAGRVDVKNDDFVGQGEGGAELLAKSLGARVEVGLEDRDQATRFLFAQGREGRPHRGRVVGVVVVYTGAATRALEFEWSGHP